MLINKGGLVSCTHCTATWETWRQHGVCEYCERHMEIDAGSRACADCLTFKGDGVGHDNVCDHDACGCDAKRDARNGVTAWACQDCGRTFGHQDAARECECGVSHV